MSEAPPSVPAPAKAAPPKQPFSERVAKAVLNLSPKSRMVLLGAGASREAGFPIATELDHVFRDSDLPIYTVIADALSVGGVDVERVLRLMELLADHGPDAVAHDLAQLDLHVGRLMRFADKRKSLADKLNAEIIRITAILRDSLWRQPAPLPSRASATKPPPQPWDYLKPLINAQRGSTVATLNYDNALELAGGKAVRTAKDAAVISVPGLSDSYVRVLKLHGSMDWKRVDDDVTHSPDPFAGIPYEPAIIFGSGNKLRHYGPFLELLREFQLALAKADQLIVIGYGWRDAHINSEIKRWARPSNRQKYLKVNVMPGEAQPRLVSYIESEYRHVMVRVLPRTASEMIPRLF